jgi:hypothetical protein
MEVDLLWRPWAGGRPEALNRSAPKEGGGGAFGRRGRSAYRRLLVVITSLVLFWNAAHAQDEGAPALASQPNAVPPIWFFPEDEYARAAAGFPVNDYRDLFVANSAALWSKTLAHLSAFGLGGNVAAPSRGDEELSRILTFLREHGLPVILNAGMVEPDPTTGCGGGEGYSYNLNAPRPVSTSNRGIVVLANHIKRLGGVVDYISMDEPLYRGHLLAWLGKPAGKPDAPTRTGCRYPIDMLAQKVQPSIQLIRSIFPDVKIGETINLNKPAVTHLSNEDYIERMEQWASAYRAATREPMAFSLIDIGQDRTQWQILPKLSAFYHSQGTALGILYTAPGTILEDDTWVQTVVNTYKYVEGTLGARPDFVAFASWVRCPQYNLPESKPGSFTNLILDYLAFRGVSRSPPGRFGAVP